MNRSFLLALGLVVGGVAGQGVEAQAGPTVEERLIRLEAGQKRLAQRLEDTNRWLDDLREDMNVRFEELRTDTNTRFEELRADTNTRFDDMNTRFDGLTFWLQLLLGGVFAILGAMVVQWVTTVRRTDRLETRVNGHLAETEKDRLLAFQREAIEELWTRLKRVEHALEGK